MKEGFIIKAFVNSLAVILLITLILTPIYFANNIARVAGVKTESPYLLVSQIEKFPNLNFSQANNHYQIRFSKFGTSQAYLGVLIINNPTDQTRSFKIDLLSPNAKIFFGEDLQNQRTEISLPSGISIPISLYADELSTQSVEFTIYAN